MFKYIVGTVTMIERDVIVVEVNNIGYEIFVSKFEQFKLGKEHKVFVYNHIREDANVLFGFSTIAELNFYTKLITVKGIGPKTGLNLMCEDLNAVIYAIKNADEKYLTKFNGIGPKAAKQIILDLASKMPDNVKGSEKNSANNLEEYNKAIETLLSIGIPKGQIKQFEAKIKQMSNESDIVKYVLANRGK